MPDERSEMLEQGCANCRVVGRVPWLEGDRWWVCSSFCFEEIKGYSDDAPTVDEILEDR